MTHRLATIHNVTDMLQCCVCRRLSATVSTVG